MVSVVGVVTVVIWGDYVLTMVSIGSLWLLWVTMEYGVNYMVTVLKL